ncbi:MAG: hypothetical protein HW416_2203 [Chloroflexi bacterium]|nr:hypothetical protein [Chloroflexota bacterium]
MYVGACLVQIEIPGAESLKDKRAVLQSAMTRVRNQFHVSIAEVESQDRWTTGALGIAVVSNDAVHARAVLDRAVRFLERARLDASIGEVEFEIVDVF